MINQLQRLTLTTALVTVSSLFITPVVSALTLYNVSGTFNDTGTLNGSFNYDAGTDTYTNINLTTTAGNSLSGATYIATSSNNEDVTPVFGASAEGFSIESDNPNLLLDLVFASLATEPSSVQLNSRTQEEDFSTDETRQITEGTVTAVPFELTPSLGLLLLLTIFGTQQGWKYRRRGWQKSL